MAFAPGDTKFAVQYGTAKIKYISTFAASCNAGTTMVARAEDAAKAWGKTNGLSKMLDTSIGFDHVEAFDLTNTLNSAIHDFSTANTTGGTHTNNVPPVQVAVVLTELTAHRGKSYRGRMYLAGADYGRMNSDRTGWDVTADFVSAPPVFLAQLNGAVGATTPLMCVASRRLGLLTPVTSLRVNSYLGSQRRRSEHFE